VKSVQPGTGFSFPPLTPFVKKAIIVLLSAYVAELVLMNFMQVPIFALLALDTSHLGVPTLWQLFTFVLVDDPSGVGSMLVGLVFIWLILSPFEASFGTRRTEQLCAFAVLTASLPALLVGLLISSFVSGVATVLFGSFPLAYAGIAAMAVVLKGRRLSIFGLWSMTSGQLLMVMAGLSLLFFLATKNVAMFSGSLGALAGGSWFALWMTGQVRRTGSKRSSASWFKLIRGGGSDSNRPPRWIN
jgi:hypothetical protein